MKRIYLITNFLIIVKAFSDSSDDIYGQNHVNFNEIFTNSISLLNDDTIPQMNKDEEFQMMSSMPAVALGEIQEFTGSSTETPRPRYPKKKDLITTTEPPQTTQMKTTTTNRTTTTSTTSTTTTTTTPVPTTSRPRGMLDLIFPASRVRGFKNAFDTFRRMLSYTF